MERDSTGRRLTRRHLIATAGVSCLGLGAGCSAIQPGGENGNESENGNETDGNGDETDGEDVPTIDGGAVVFVYDDGPMSDYETAFPVHQEFDAPASTAVVTEWMGRQDFDGSDWMTIEQLDELESAGWEIMSHTTSHTALGEFELVEDAAADDTRIYPEDRSHGFNHGNDIEITDGDTSVRRTIVNSNTDGTGGYLELDEALGESFSAGEAVERYPDDVMNDFLETSKNTLEDHGLTVDTLLAPYDVVDEWAIEHAKQYYDGIANVNPDSMHNDRDAFDPFDTHRAYFIEFTDQETIETELDRAARQENIAILGAHSFKEEVTEDRIRETLERVDELDLEVVTFRDAIRATNG